MSEDLHLYDNRERRFRFDDDTRTAGLAWVAKIMRLPAAPSGARFDLCFYSGGIGIIDQLAIAIAADVDEAARIASRLHFAVPRDFTGDDFADLAWLVGFDDDNDTPFEVAVVDFVAQNRSAFQPDYVQGDPIWFELDSGVNHWSVVWHSRGELGYLGYDQG